MYRKTRICFVALLVLISAGFGVSSVAHAVDGDELMRCNTFVVTDGNDRLAMICSLNISASAEIASWTAGSDYTGGSTSATVDAMRVPHVRSSGTSYEECGGGNFQWSAELGPQTSSIFGTVPYGWVGIIQTSPSAACNGGYGASSQSAPFSTPGTTNDGLFPELDASSGTFPLAWRSGDSFDSATWGEVETYLGLTAQADVAAFLNGNYPAWFDEDDVPPGEEAPNACESVDVSVEFKPVGADEFEALANPSGTVAIAGDTIRLTINRVDDTIPTSFAFRWQETDLWEVLGGGPTMTYPATATLTKAAADGPPSDLGAAEILCRSEGASRYLKLAGTSEWVTTSEGERPCANITWYWPRDDTFLGDGTVYPVSLTFSGRNGGDAVVEGLYVDHDDDTLTPPEGVLAHFDYTDSDTWDMRVPALYHATVGGTEEVDFLEDAYNPPDGSFTTLIFGITLTGGAGVTYDASKFGVWCNDDVGSPILYRFDSTYVADAIPDPFDDDGGRSLGACFGDSLGSMSLTSPKSWVTGIGRMGTCIVEYLFVPDDDTIAEMFDDFTSAAEEQFPISLLFMLIDFGDKLGDELSDPSGTGCFDMPASFGFGSFSVAMDDVCVGDGLSPTSPQRDLLAALCVAPMLWALCAHAVRMVRGV